MTVTTHAYTAELDDTTTLSPKGGQITLDAGATVHVEGTLTLAVEDTALLGALDPRDSRRVVISATLNDTPPRLFDLGIRSASPNRADGTVTLDLASDEAILKDFAQLGDDKGPRVHEASIRAVCGYVLDKIGATLEPGLDDADVTAYWSVTNLIKNSLFAATADGWGIWDNSSSITHVVFGAEGALRWTATAAADSAIATTALETVTPGKWYVFAVEVGGPSARNAMAGIRWWTGSGTTTMGTVYGAPALTATLYPDARVYVVAQAPAGADRAQPLVRTTGNNVAGIQYYIRQPMFHEGDEPVPFFHGGTPDDADYAYEWADPAVPTATTSTRTPVIERRPEALTWRAGVSAMDFLRALLLTTGLRLVCDEQRRWTLRSDLYRAGGSQSWRYGVNITAADESLSRDDDSWFDAAVYVYTWTDDDGIAQTRTDAHSLTPTPTKVLRRELRNTPYPGPGRAAHIVNRAQGRGRTVTVSGIPAWTEHTDQELAILLDGTPIQTGITERVRFDLDTDEVTITSRTTDTPAGAIDLLVGTINALTGIINDL